MLREIKSTQRATRLLAIRLNGTGTAALDGEGKYDATLTDNGTGDYTLTFAKPFGRAPIVVANSETAGVIVKLEALSKTAVQITSFAVDGTTAKDAILHVMVFGSDVEDQY